MFNFFTSPNIAKLTDKRSTNLLVLISLIVLIGMINTAFTEFFPIIWVLIIGCLLSLVTIRLNQIQWSSIILITSSWITLTWFIGAIEGITNVNMIYYFFIVLMSVYLLPKNYWLIVLTITIATISLIAIAQTNQLIEIQSSKPSNYYVLTNHIIQIIASIGTFVYTREMWLKREGDLEKSQLQLLRETTALAAANKTLSISETRFRDLVEHAPEAIILYDVEKEKIVEANSKASQLIGMSKPALLKAIPWALLGDGQKFDETHYDLQSQVLMGKLITLKQNIRHADGHHIPVSVQAIRLPGEGSPLFRISVSDLTPILEKEAQIQRQETLLDQVSEAIISTDLNYHVTSWNPAAEKIYGWKSSEAVGKFITDLIPTTVMNHSSYALEKENDYRVEVRQSRKDGSTIYVSSSISPYLDLEGNLIGTLVANRNISKRYKMQQDLRETTERLNSLINNIPTLIGHADKNGVIVFLNDFHKSFGLNPADLVGIVYMELFSAAEQAILKPHVEKALAGERTEFEMYITILDKKYFMEIVIIPRKPDHSLDGFYVMAIDRTERLKALEALLDSQKVDSLGVLAGGIAHDFNNLLAAIMMQGSLAQLQLAESSPIQNNLSKLMDTAERAAMLAKQMLAYSGRGQTEVTVCNLNDVIKDSLRLFRTSIEPHIKLSLDYYESLPLIEADLTQIQQVILNLLLNANEAVGGQKGEIGIKTEILIISEDTSSFWQYTGKFAVAGEYVCLSVFDTGSGMDAATLAKVFDPFFTTKHSGTGLGLAAVLGIVRGHGGGVEVISAVNQGTTFNIYLPTLKLPEKEHHLTPER